MNEDVELGEVDGIDGNDGNDGIGGTVGVGQSRLEVFYLLWQLFAQ